MRNVYMRNVYMQIMVRYTGIPTAVHMYIRIYLYIRNVRIRKYVCMRRNTHTYVYVCTYAECIHATTSRPGVCS